MNDCGWCGRTDVEVTHEVLHEVRGATVDRWFDTCDDCVELCRQDGEKDPDVVGVQVEKLTLAGAR